MNKTYMTISNDEKEALKQCINKNFKKFRSDPIEDGWVFHNLALYIDDNIYRIRNEIEPTDYFGYPDDVSKIHFESIQENEVESWLENVKQIDVEINDKIKKIFIINEKQTKYKNNESVHEMYFTKGIVFETSLRQYSFMKEEWDYEEHIEIDRGVNVIDKLLTLYKKEDKEMIDDGITYTFERSVEEIK